MGGSVRDVLKVPVLLAGAILALGYGMTRLVNQPAFPGLNSLAVRAPAFPKPGLHVSGTVWIDSPPLTWADLKGKVVLVDFWEYTCINCIRTFAFNKLWYERYHRYGFEIVGVHAPEFDIAFNVDNVRTAVKRFGLPYPIVVDDWFTIWKSIQVPQDAGWPARFLVDAKGIIRYRRTGEGADREFELAIRNLLQQAHPGLTFPASYTLPSADSPFAPGCGVPTDEMYMGPTYPGRDDLANPGAQKPGETKDYKLLSSVADGRAIVGGRWQTDPNGMIYEGKSQEPGPKAAQLEMRYHARELYAVINVSHGKPSQIYIQQDGEWLTQKNKGVDVKFDSQGRSYLTIAEPRMYYLIANSSFGSHQVSLFPTEPGLTINSFTFGNNCQTDFPHL